MKNFIFLYYGPHPFHRGIAKFLGCYEWDILSSKYSIRKRILNYLKFSISAEENASDVILLCEGTFLIPALFKLLPFKRFKKVIVNISADPHFYYYKINRLGLFRRYLIKVAIKKVNLFLCVGKMEETLLKEINPKAKSIVIYPFIEEERYNKLFNIPIKTVFNHNILFIGGGPDFYYKGLDLLVEAFKMVKREFGDAELFIIGKWNEDLRRTMSYPGINFVGFIHDIDKYIEMSSLYVHVGRGDAFPVSVLEALLGGLPCIVSEHTGSREVVKELREDFVVPVDVYKVAEKIIDYFNLREEEKRTLSQKAKEIGKRFKKEIILKDFSSKWSSFLENEK
ncbi:MAG: glycosyltransferase family 4 protein [Dictyoglomus thermophilum]|nr:glycosyltransferase family 4 protein [Dictyoglomus thermophilum]MCX7721120.1 glycosyltransferase family 4 protein [Dictyoglomus thermophilum]